MKQIIEIYGGGMCPAQYEGQLDSGEYFYARCRGGRALLYVGTQEEVDNFEVEPCSEIVWENDPYKGYFEEQELIQLFNQAKIITGDINHLNL